MPSPPAFASYLLPFGAHLWSPSSIAALRYASLMAVLDKHASSRKLAAILSGDIAGYSAMMGSDEEGTVRKLQKVQEAVLPLIERFGGRVIDLAGDGILAEFSSAVRAVESAAEVQSRMAERNMNSGPPMLFRIGVNVGDVIQEGERLYGDGFNAQPGCKPSLSPAAFASRTKCTRKCGIG